MQLSIIIVNYNVCYFLEHCLHSVQVATSKLDVEVIVVDNNSTDGSIAYLQPLFPWVKWISNRKNTGFGVANNQAVAVAKGEYILFLNPDTLLPEDCLKKCLAFMQMHPKAGALGIKMLDGSGCFLPESKRGFPSPLTSLFKLTGLAARFPKSSTFAKYYLGHLSNYKNTEADVLAGAFMLIRHSVLHQTGAFDERFFMYGEDIDLSYRIQQAGWQNWYFADSCIIHFKGESTKKGNLNYVRMFYQAMNLFVQKHYSGGSAFLYRWLIQCAIWCRAGVTLAASAVRKLKTAFTPKSNNFLSQKLLVIGSHQVFMEVSRILQTNIGSTVTINHFTATSSSLHIIEAIKNWHPQQIIFCIDETLSLTTVMEVMALTPAKQFGFYYTQGQSIISSSSKNSSGQWLAE